MAVICRAANILYYIFPLSVILIINNHSVSSDNQLIPVNLSDVTQHKLTDVQTPGNKTFQKLNNINISSITVFIFDYI